MYIFTAGLFAQDKYYLR